MPEEACRPATSADVARLAQLVEGSIAQQRAQKGGELWAATRARLAPFEARLEEEIASDDEHLLVGTLDGIALGFGAAHVEVLHDGRRLGVVTDLYVEPEGREVGIGEALMNGLVAWCTEVGCFGVDSIALPGDRSTKNFFESFGLVARAIVVHKPLA